MWLQGLQHKWQVMPKSIFLDKVISSTINTNPDVALASLMTLYVYHIPHFFTFIVSLRFELKFLFFIFKYFELIIQRFFWNIKINVPIMTEPGLDSKPAKIKFDSRLYMLSFVIIAFKTGQKLSIFTYYNLSILSSKILLYSTPFK